MVVYDALRALRALRCVETRLYVGSGGAPGDTWLNMRTLYAGRRTSWTEVGYAREVAREVACPNPDQDHGDSDMSKHTV